MATLESRIAGLANRPLDIVAVGSALYEQVVRVEDWPRSGMQGNIRAPLVAIGAGGCAVNVSAYAARLGARTAAIAALGGGQYGRPVLDELALSGVDTSWMKVVEGREGGLIIILSGSDGGWVTLDHTDPEIALGVEDIPAAPFERARFLHIDGYSYVTAGSEAMAEAALATARAAGCLVSVDSSVPAAAQKTTFLRNLYRRCDIAFANAEEAALVTGEADPERATAALLALGPAAAIVKLGAAGSIVASAAGQVRIPAHAVSVVDTISAGDAYVAATLAALCRGLDLAAAAQQGAAAGALACRAAGSLASRFNLHDLETFLRTRI